MKLLGAIFILCGLLFLVLPLFIPRTGDPGAPPFMGTSAHLPQEAPEPTPRDVVPAQRGFQHLVSHTDTGFAPLSLEVEFGEVVRFVNISKRTTQISVGEDTSAPLERGMYWEYVVSSEGVLGYRSSATESGGTIIIQ